MNERKIIDRKYLCDLAKEVGLTTLDLEALGENHHWEIVVEGNLLERMIETQRQFERLAVIGDEEYRGFYIEVPRPTPEDWTNAEELIASGEYSSMDAYLSDWFAFNPMETLWFYVTSRKHGNNRSIYVTDRKFTHFVISNRSSYNEKEFDDVCCKENLTRFFDFLDLMIGVIVAVMALIPMFGVTIGIIIGAFLILTVNPTQAVWFVVMMIIIQQIEGNLIYPRVAGSVMGLPALWVMTSIIVGGKVFGFVGMLVIVPIVSVIYTILRRVVHVRLRKRKIPKNKIKTSKVLVTTPIHAVNPNSEKGREAKSVIGSLKKKTTYSIKKHTSNNKKK